MPNLMDKSVEVSQAAIFGYLIFSSEIYNFIDVKHYGSMH